jgi:hypothetical protein
MGWQINLVKNDVKIDAKTAQKLFNEAQDYEGELWYDIDDVTDYEGDNTLNFDPDHMEHMDYLATHDKVVEILKEAKVSGDICFASEDGDNAGEAWGYRFDGKGGMKILTGERTWS